MVRPSHRTEMTYLGHHPARIIDVTPTLSTHYVDIVEVGCSSHPSSIPCRVGPIRKDGHLVLHLVRGVSTSRRGPFLLASITVLVSMHGMIASMSNLKTVQQVAEMLSLTDGRIRQICRAHNIGMRIGHNRLLTPSDIR